MKRLLSALLSIALVISLAACGQSITPTLTAEERFDVFLEQLPAEFVDSNDWDLEFLFVDPSQFGIEEGVHELPFQTEEEYKESMVFVQELLTRLKAFPYGELTENQQLTYDVLENFLKCSLEMEDYYLFENSYLGTQTGFQVQLPFLLEEYTFDKKMDIDSYLNLCNTAPEAFRKYADMEKARQEGGVGFSQYLLDRIIDQANQFASQETLFFEASYYEQIDSVTFLSDEERAEYRAKGPDAFANFRSAYVQLADDLKTIQGAEETLGLPSRPNGDAYFTTLAHTQLGVDMTPVEIEEYLNDRGAIYFNTLVTGILNIPDVDEKLNEMQYPTIASTDVDEILEYLYERIQADFPPLDMPNYQIRYIPEALSEYYSPAAYIIGRIDAPESEVSTIQLNGEYEPSSFTTIAHEGVPGHMYQDLYFKSLDMPTIRSMLSMSSYQEGWATYVEHCAISYADGDPEILDLMAANIRLSNVYLGLLDLGVNYHGWTLEEFNAYYTSVFGVVDDESIQEFYCLFVESPGNYLKYMLSAEIFLDLRSQAEEALGDAFDPIAYHKVILDTGSCSFPVLQKQVDKYIAANTPK